jgi:hypothetical protein
MRPAAIAFSILGCGVVTTLRLCYWGRMQKHPIFGVDTSQWSFATHLKAWTLYGLLVAFVVWFAPMVPELIFPSSSADAPARTDPRLQEPVVTTYVLPDPAGR